MKKMRTSERGNAVIFILIAIALFAALAYTFTRSSQQGQANMYAGQSKMAVIDYQACLQTVQAMDQRLQQRGCAGMVSYNEDGSNNISGAPTDGSCSMFHANGGNLEPCSAECPAEMMKDLSVGESCGGLIYAGESSGRRIYAASGDAGDAAWSSGGSTTGATSLTDGLANTNTLLSLSDAGAPYPAAQLCRSIGLKWYLPARNELELLKSVKNVGAFNGTFQEAGTGPGPWDPTNIYYWTSVEANANVADSLPFNNWINGNGKTSARRVRCIRRD